MGLPIKQSKSTFVTGNGSVGDTVSEQITVVPFDAKKGVTVQCTSGTIYVGHNENVTAANGFPLVSINDDSIEIAIDDPTKVWVIGAAAGQTYKWIAS